MKKKIFLIKGQITKVLLLVLCLSIHHLSFSQTTFGGIEMISTVSDIESSKIFSGDLNGDGYDDILICSSSQYKLAWSANNGNGAFDEIQFISESAGNVNSAYVADLDGDGDNDILASTGCHGDVVWYRNIDGNGNFSEINIISDISETVVCVIAADVDSDGDMDVFSASLYDDKIAWYRNDGIGNFSSEIIISYAIIGPASLYAVDIDGDTDLDIVSGAYLGNMVAWHENRDGLGNFNQPEIISEAVGNTTAVCADDIDGDIDVVSTSYKDNKVAWYSNIDGLGLFGEQQLISTQSLGAQDVLICDLDNDGDNDVITAPIRGDAVIWHVNSGDGVFDVKKIVEDPIDGPQSICIADVDQDLDFEIFTSCYDVSFVFWNENYSMEIFEHPSDIYVCKDSILSFEVSAKDVLEYHWQIKKDSLEPWIYLNDDAFFSGTHSENIKVEGRIGDAWLRCELKTYDTRLYSDSAKIIYDSEPPVISLIQEDSHYYADTNCEFMVRDYIPMIFAEDNCGDTLIIDQLPKPGEVISGLENGILITALDNMGNITEFPILITILDSINPHFGDLENIEVDAGESLSYIVLDDELDSKDYSDNCGINSIVNSLNAEASLKGAYIPVGKTKVNWEIIDFCGNIDTCSHYILVNEYIDPLDFSINLFPNPVWGDLNLDYHNIQIEKIFIWDISGRLVGTFTEQPFKKKIDFLSFREGLYFLEIHSDKNVVLKRVIKSQ